MRRALGPYLASFAQARRRSVMLLVLITLGIFGAVAWSSYGTLRTEKKFLALLASDRPMTEQTLFEFGVGFGCEFFGPPEQGIPGPEPAGTDSQAPSETPTGTPETPTFVKPGFGEQGSCQLFSRSGTPVGPKFPVPNGGFEGPQISTTVLEEVRPQMLAEERVIVAQAKEALALRALFQSRVRSAGTILGIAFVVLFAATFFGAEWRWGVWRTLLTHEPRRGRVLASKFAAMWTLVAVGLAAALALAAGIDIVMRMLNDVHTHGGPSVTRLAKESGWAVLSLETYATLAGAMALAVRTSLAGLMSLPFAVGDFLFTRKFVWMRPFSPVQQIARLLGHVPEGSVASGYGWFEPIRAKFVCTKIAGQRFLDCKEIVLKPIPNWRATLVLLAWIGIAAMLGYVVLRKRDVPQ